MLNKINIDTLSKHKVGVRSVGKANIKCLFASLVYSFNSVDSDLLIYLDQDLCFKKPIRKLFSTTNENISIKTLILLEVLSSSDHLICSRLGAECKLSESSI